MIDLAYDIDVNLNMYADNHEFYSMSSDIEVVEDNLTRSVIDASECYTSNFLKGNLDKYRILMLGSKLDNNINIVMDDKAVTSTDCLELIGLSIDRHLRSDEHTSKIYKKSSQRVGVLMRLRNLIPLVLSYNYLKLLFFPI